MGLFDGLPAQQWENPTLQTFLRDSEVDLHEAAQRQQMARVKMEMDQKKQAQQQLLDAAPEMKGVKTTSDFLNFKANHPGLWLLHPDQMGAWEKSVIDLERIKNTSEETKFKLEQQKSQDEINRRSMEAFNTARSRVTDPGVLAKTRVKPGEMYTDEQQTVLNSHLAKSGLPLINETMSQKMKDAPLSNAGKEEQDYQNLIKKGDADGAARMKLRMDTRGQPEIIKLEVRRDIAAEKKDYKAAGEIQSRIDKINSVKSSAAETPQIREKVKTLRSEIALIDKSLSNAVNLHAEWQDFNSGKSKDEQVTFDYFVKNKQFEKKKLQSAIEKLTAGLEPPKGAKTEVDPANPLNLDL